MKKNIYCLMMMMFAFSTFTFTSCDEDVDRAMVLSGQWRGDFLMSYDWQLADGTIVTFDSYDTDIVFYPDYDYATHGWGKQVDFYEYGPYERQYYKFYWSVRDGFITLRYPKNPEYDATIADYTMTNSYLTGWFDGGSNNKFRLYKIADYYNWDVYYDDYCYYDRLNWYDSWYNWYYHGYKPSKTRSNEDVKAPMAPDYSEEEMTNGKIVGGRRHFNR